METNQNYEFEITLYFLDYKEVNKYSHIQFETLFQNSLIINSNKLNINLCLDKNSNLSGIYEEKIKFIPINKNDDYIEYTLPLNCDIHNLFSFMINEDNGNNGLEITAMWAMNPRNDEKIEEREIGDILYDGNKIESEKLYERKRWNIFNVNAEKLNSDLFSQKTLDYINKNKNKNYKYDIILDEDNNNTKFFHEKEYEVKVKYLEDSEKEKFRENLSALNLELSQNIQAIQKYRYSKDYINKVNIIKNFFADKKNTYLYYKKIFDIYNGKWNLSNFSENDLKLFISFSDLQIYFLYFPNKYIDTVTPKYEKLKQKVISNNNLSLTDKARIICGYSKFCSSLLENNMTPELFIVDELKEDDPFKIALEKHKVIINELKEYSGYFKKLLIFDMGSSEIINDWDLKDCMVENLVYCGGDVFSFNTKFDDFKKELKKLNSKKEPMKEKITKLTFPVLSMLTLKQVKEHLLDILPKYFFKISENYKYNAISDSVNRISYFNESAMLEFPFFEKTLLPQECVLPIMIEISHETYSHIKTRFTNSSCDSPLLTPIDGKNKLLCPNDYKGETGFVLEYFICDNFTEFKNLKIPNINLFELTKPEYWTDTNFNKLKEFNRKNMYETGLNYKDLFYTDIRNGQKKIGCVF